MKTVMVVDDEPKIVQLARDYRRPRCGSDPGRVPARRHHGARAGPRLHASAAPRRGAWCRVRIVRARDRRAREERSAQARARCGTSPISPHGLRGRLPLRGDRRVTRGRWDSSRRPPWWPENEAFPPAGGWDRARWARGGVMRRMALFFTAAAVFAIVTATFIFWTLVTALGAPDLAGNVARGFALLIVLYGFLYTARSLRRIA